MPTAFVVRERVPSFRFEFLGARLAGVLAELGPLPASALAAQVRRRRATVLETLHGDGRFAWSGKRRASRWSLANPVRSFDAEEAARVWGVDLGLAHEMIFGDEGFLERGLVASVNGNGAVYVTALGLAASEAFRSLGPEAVA